MSEASDSTPMCIWVVDLTGREWRSDPDVDGEMTIDTMAAVANQLKNLRAIASFHLTINGREVYFNPAHIVAWGFISSGASLQPLGSGANVASQAA